MIIRESDIKFEGKPVTYVTDYDSVGFGYYRYEDRQVYKSGANGFYYPVQNLKQVIHDGGRQYRERVNGLNLAEAYKN